MLSAWRSPEFRLTMDIDIPGRTNNDETSIVAQIQDLDAVRVKAHGLIFDRNPNQAKRTRIARESELGFVVSWIQLVCCPAINIDNSRRIFRHRQSARTFNRGFYARFSNAARDEKLQRFTHIYRRTALWDQHADRQRLRRYPNVRSLAASMLRPSRAILSPIPGVSVVPELKAEEPSSAGAGAATGPRRTR